MPSVSMPKKALAIAAAVSLAQLASGASNAQNKTRSALVEAYQLFAQSNGDKSQRRAALSELFLSLDHDGNGISTAEYNQAEAISNARQRAFYAQNVLAYDLDGDLAVTRKEIETVLDFKPRHPLTSLTPAEIELENNAAVERKMAGDANNNGSLEGGELLSAPVHRNYGDRRQVKVSPFALIHALLNADPNADGLLTAAETVALLAEITGPGD